MTNKLINILIVILFIQTISNAQINNVYIAFDKINNQYSSNFFEVFDTVNYSGNILNEVSKNQDFTKIKIQKNQLLSVVYNKIFYKYTYTADQLIKEVIYQ